jgi:hypothetical protein
VLTAFATAKPPEMAYHYRRPTEPVLDFTEVTGGLVYTTPP